MIVRKDISILFILLGLILVLFATNLVLGEVKIPFSEILQILNGKIAENKSWSFIIENRLNRSIVAVFSGGALAISGLILQVYFRNPLAGPGVLGISSGAALGIAFVILGGFTLGSFSLFFSHIFAGILGAFAILILLLFISKFIHQTVTLLVVGLMLGYFTSAIINVLYHWSDAEKTRSFVIWGLGSFDSTGGNYIYLLICIIVLCLLVSIFLIKPLNALSLGEEYAKGMGINIFKTKILIIIITSVLTATVTVFCGPIAFIGVAVPQIVYRITKSKNFKLLIPYAFVVGGLMGVFSDIIVRLGDNSLPLNTVTSLVGAPIIIYTIIKMNR